MSEEIFKEETKEKIEINKNPVENYKLAEISRFEFLLYLAYWFIIVLSSCYTFHQIGYNKKTVKYFLTKGYIERTYFGLYKDTSEMMWKNLITRIDEGWPYFAISLLVSVILRLYTSPKYFMFGCVSLSIYFNYHNSSLKFLGLQIAIFVAAAVAGFTRSKTLVWIFGLTMFYYFRKIENYPFFHFEYIFGCGLQYMALLVTRGISVGIAIAEAPKFTFQLILEMSFYFWYFPAIFGCRMMVTRDFVAQIYKPFVVENWKVWINSCLRLVIYFFLWTVIINVVHFKIIYLTHDMKYINFAFLIGSQIFGGIHYYMFYLMLYKGGYLMSQLDGFLTADGPECIAHVALFTQMWKNFDTGMHNWLKDVIFRPIVRLGPWYITKYVAAMACFGFVILFQGIVKPHIVWVSLNIFQYCMENLLTFLFLRTWFGSYMRETFSAINLRRIIAFVVGISFFVSIYGFGCFLYGMEINNSMYGLLVNQNFSVVFQKWIFLLLFVYSHAQISLTTNQYLSKKKLKTS